MLGRRILSEEERLTVMEHWQYQCYICCGDIINADEAEFVHIVPLDRGGTFSLSNYAPLHNYCYLKAEDQDLDFAREDAHISESFATDFDRLFEARRAEPVIEVDEERMVASVDDEPVRLYRCPTTNTLYFYHQLPAAYLEADPTLAPHSLNRQRVVALASHLKDHPQLNPVVCRLEEGHLRIVAGLHRAAAQYLGNRSLRIDCKVLVSPDPILLGQAEHAVRGALRTRPRKPAPVTDWLLRKFRDRITAWQEIHPGEDLTEAVVFFAVLEMKEPQAQRALESFLESWIKDTASWKQWVTRCKEDAVIIPESLSAYLGRAFLQTRPNRVVLESEQDYRSEEEANMVHLLDIIAQDGMFAAADSIPFGPALLQTFMREAGALLWTRMLADACRIVLQRSLEEGICMGPRFTPLEAARIRRAVQNLFQHPFWQDLELDRALRHEDRLYVDRARDKWGLNHRMILRS